MIITLSGNNSFELKRRLDQLVGQFVSKQGDLALERIDGEESEPQAVLDAVQSLPFLAERKMVVVRNLGSNKKASDLIEQIISSAGESTDLIIYEPSPDKRTVYFKVLKSKTKLEEYNQMDGRALASWLVEKAKNQAAELSFNDANYLVIRLGANQQMLDSELTKLITYDPKINRENIDLLTEPTPQSKIFDLLDAAFSGQKDRTLKLYQDQRAQKVEPQAILSLLSWQLQLLALAKYSATRPAEQVARDSGMSPYPVSKAKSLAGKITETKLKEMVNAALEIDIRSKTTAMDLDEALKSYLVTL